MKNTFKTDMEIKGCYNCPLLVNNCLGELCVLLDEYMFAICEIPDKCPLRKRVS